jgi:hypothetical protein
MVFEMTRNARSTPGVQRASRVLFIVALLGATAVTFIPRTASFDLAVSTESVEVVTSSSYKPIWYVNGSQLSDGSGAASRPCTGSIEIAPNVRITLQRIGTGPLNVEVESAGSSIQRCGMISNTGESTSVPLGRKAILKITDITQRSAAGQSTVLPLGGEVRLGTSGEMPTSQFTPLLRQGQISVLGRNFLGSDLYKGTPQSLEPGDVVVFKDPEGPAYGLATVDERPAINATLHVLAREAVIRRPPAAGYTVGLTVLDRLKNDGSLQGIWGTFIFFLGLRKLGE